MSRRAPEKPKRRGLEAATADTQARPKRRRNESSGTLATSTFHKRRSFPTTDQARMRIEFWKCFAARSGAAPIRSRPATTDRNLETKEQAAPLTTQSKRPGYA